MFFRNKRIKAGKLCKACLNIRPDTQSVGELITSSEYRGSSVVLTNRLVLVWLEQYGCQKCTDVLRRSFGKNL
jgi:hypothetical protein